MRDDDPVEVEPRFDRSGKHIGYYLKGDFSMANPRDAAKPQWGVPVNIWTGYPITESQQLMIDRLKEACAIVARVLHDTDGSDPDGSGFSTRRTSICGTHLEELQLMAMREILDR